MSSKCGSVIINGVETCVRTWGRWIEDPADKINENIIVIIPGNPGVTEFYTEFADVIHKRTGYSVWAISYAGHELSKGIPPFKENKEKYGLKGQIEHKIEFFRKYVRKDARVHVIGHSIGAYTALQLLKDLPTNNKIAKAYLLFPAIERMAETSHGKLITGYVKHIVWLICFLSAIFAMFPRILQVFLVRVYFFTVYTPEKDYLIHAVQNLVNPVILKNVFFMALEEMEQVRERDDDIIKKNIDKINILYGEFDGWAPKSFYDKIKRDIIGVHCSLSSYSHAFVLKQSKAVGCAISDCIINNKYLS